ncbi:MAG: 2-keto-4-pentenoate hydratase [Egibacteraceae bacterium]
MLDARAIADDLATAERERKPLAPFTDVHPDLDLATAYEAQWLAVRDRIERGERLIGAKLGLTSRAKQEAMGVAEPLYGWLTSGMLADPGAPLDLDQLIAPRVEPEIAFLLGRDLEAPASITSVLAATEAVFGALEILDSRYENFRFKLADVVADNASAAGVVLGPVSRPPSALEDLRLLGCVLRDGGQVTATAAGAAVMGHPAAAICWLVRRLASGSGPAGLPAGSIVLSGGLTAPVPLIPGGVVTAEFDGLGTVEAHASGAAGGR